MQRKLEAVTPSYDWGIWCSAELTPPLYQHFADEWLVLPQCAHGYLPPAGSLGVVS